LCKTWGGSPEDKWKNLQRAISMFFVVVEVLRFGAVCLQVDADVSEKHAVSIFRG
jgi:hypothetical protein